MKPKPIIWPIGLLYFTSLLLYYTIVILYNSPWVWDGLLGNQVQNPYWAYCSIVLSIILYLYIIVLYYWVLYCCITIQFILSLGWAIGTLGPNPLLGIYIEFEVGNWNIMPKTHYWAYCNIVLSFVLYLCYIVLYCFTTILLG